MFFSSDEKANVIIGEAAMNLFNAGQEVNVELLIKELLIMAGSEVNESRLEQMQDARQWLSGFKTIGSRRTGAANWLSGNAATDPAVSESADDIYFRH